MTVAGYNHIPDVNDHEPVIGVDYNEGLTTATVYIAQEYSQEELEMTAEEMRVLRGRLLTAIEKIEWLEATYLYARGFVSTDISHLMHKDGHSKTGKALCGRAPKEGPWGWEWRFEPVVKHPGDWHMCKKCMKIYEKERVNA